MPKGEIHLKNKAKSEKQIEKEMFEKIYIKLDKYEVPEFSKKLHGYNKAEVDIYLNALVDAYNKMHDDYQALEAELSEHRQNRAAIADALIEAKITAAEIMNGVKAPIHENTPEPVVLDGVVLSEETLSVDELKPFPTDFEKMLADIKSGNGG